MAADFGVDFGTTNSVAAFIGGDPKTGRQRAYVLKNREDNRPHPSVVWYHGTETIVGRRAKQQLGQLGLGVFGDIVRSPKMYLGSAQGIFVGSVVRPAKDVVADILKFVRQDALDRDYPNRTYANAVMTIPVSLLGRARSELREAALQAGYHVHQFVHEPMAALYGFLRSQPNFGQEVARLERRFILVFDWGGGTLDITLCQLLSGALVQVLSVGEHAVGGDRFDERLFRLVKSRHEENYPSLDWTRLQPTADARLVQACEDAKIALSVRDKYRVYVRDVLAVEGAARDLEVEISRADLREAVKDLVRQGLHKIQEVLEAADLSLNAIDSCLATGGMVSMPAIREGLTEMFGANRLRVPDNSDSVVAEGSAWIAHDGVDVRLAKPFEILHADDRYVPLIRSHTALPTGGKSLATSFSMFCVDPRDGYAKLLFSRPRLPGRENATEPRIPHAHVTVRVDPYGKPLHERIDLKLNVDHDMIVTVSARSELRGDTSEIQVHDLEFGLGFDNAPREAPTLPAATSKLQAREDHPRKPPPGGSVRIRSNVAERKDSWGLVPGEIVQLYRPDLRLTDRQHQEKMYYQSCCLCGRSVYEIDRDGCDYCAARGYQTLSRADAIRRVEDRLRQGLPI